MTAALDTTGERRGSWSSSTTAAATRSPEMIRQYHAEEDPRIKLVDLSRNFGHQPAVTAGIHHARGDCVILIDGDLQDPPEVIPEMVAKWKEGYQVVLGERQQPRRRAACAGIGFRCSIRSSARIDRSARAAPDAGIFGLMDRARRRRVQQAARAQPLHPRPAELARLQDRQRALRPPGPRRRQAEADAAPADQLRDGRRCSASATSRCAGRRSWASRLDRRVRPGAVLLRRRSSPSHKQTGSGFTTIDRLRPVPRRRAADLRSASSASTSAASTKRSSSGRCTWCRSGWGSASGRR